jgi:hypothetical protein
MAAKGCSGWLAKGDSFPAENAAVGAGSDHSAGKTMGIVLVFNDYTW